jgi:hypothetical protein
MASYKDIIPKFNPYVEQRPVEAMMKVGMYKQQRYDEGLQKIQESIDNVAGLDVVRDVDKQYLQSKLNQLGSQLSMVAGGDFSNFQLVNSVNGMTNQISKDPNVLNAVSSAAKYKKELETIQKFRSEGKTSPSNDLIFNLQANDWLNSKDLNKSFNAIYTPYTNVDKESRSIIKDLAKQYTQNDIVFDYDENNNIIGVRDIMTKKRVEGVTADRIKTALKTGLSPQSLKQLSIDGQYKYFNTSPEEFVNNINSSYTETFSKFNEERNNLQSKLEITKNPSQKIAIQRRIEDLDQKINNVRSEYNSISKGFEEGEVTSAQAQIYSMNYIDNMANAFATQSVTTEYELSPFYEKRMKDAQLQLNKDKFEEDKRYNKKRLDIEERKAKALEDANKGISLGLKVNTENLPEDVVAVTEAKKSILQKEYDNAMEEAISIFGEEAVGQIMKSPISELDNTQLQYRNKILNAVREKTKLENAIKQTRNDAKLIHKGPEIKPEVFNFTYTNNNAASPTYGQPIEEQRSYDYVTIANIFDEFSKKYTEFYEVRAGSALSDQMYKTKLRYLDDLARRELDEVDLVLYDAWRNKDNATNERSKNIWKNYSKFENELADAEEKRIIYEADIYKKLNIVPQQRGYSITDDNPMFSAMEGVAAQLSAIMQQDGFPETDVSPDDVAAAAANLKTFTMYTDSAGDYDIELLTKDKTKITIPIPQEVYNDFQGMFEEKNEYLRKFNDIYEPLLLSNVVPVQEIEEVNSQTQKIEKKLYKPKQSFWTTNTEGKYNTDYQSGSLVSGLDFPSVRIFKMTGDVITLQNPTSTNSAILKLNINDPLTNEIISNIPYGNGTPVPKGNLVETMEQFSDKAIFELLYDKNRREETGILNFDMYIQALKNKVQKENKQ